MKGLGKYLPFADGTFDRVLFATSLDHMLSPQGALGEACRVFKRDGSLSIWFGEIDEQTSQPSLNEKLKKGPRHPLWGSRQPRGRQPSSGDDGPAYLRELRVPDGATDLFHVRHLDRGLVEQWLAGDNMRVPEVDRPKQGRSVFMQATR